MVLPWFGGMAALRMRCGSKKKLGRRFAACLWTHLKGEEPASIVDVKQIRWLSSDAGIDQAVTDIRSIFLIWHIRIAKEYTG